MAWLPQAARVLRRFLGQFRQRDNEALRAAAVGLAGQRIQADGITEEVLILDSTVCERSGRQQGARQSDNPRKLGRPNHHPLKAALGSGYGLNLGNRRADTHSAHPCLGFYEQTRRELPDTLRIQWVLGRQRVWGRRVSGAFGGPTPALHRGVAADGLRAASDSG